MNLKKYKNVIESKLFKIGPVVAFIWENKENWPVYSVSKNINKLYGYKAKEFLSSNLQYASLIHKDDINLVFDEVMQASNTNETSFEHQPYRLLCKDGTYKWVHDTTVILRKNGVITHYVGYLSDITALKELENTAVLQNISILKHEALLKSYKIAMDESSIVSKADLQGNITYVNDNFCKTSGYSRDEVIGKSHSLVKAEETSKELMKELWKTIKAKKVWKSILLNKGKNNSYYWVEISIVPILDENGDIVEYIAVRHDITKMMQQQQKLDNIANADPLTGHKNRYKLNLDIKNSNNPALAIINIDNFSQVNDFYGHTWGDDVIKQVGDILNEMIKNENCELYHLQGDEYVIFNSTISNELFLKNVINFIEHLKKSKIKIDDEDLNLNFSVSISYESKDKILLTADMALKIAKRTSKDLVVYNDRISLNDEYKNNIKWTKKIKEAIEQDMIVPVFQPIVNNETGVWEKYESLVRIQDTDGKLISPYFFLDISKKTKYYSRITKIMLQKSFEMFKEKDLEFSVNLTIDDILNEEINTYIIDMIEEYQIGHRVVFEIVESESIENFEKIREFITKVKAYGSQIAIDDFGTGYSNFEYLMKLKADYIKIDGSMIKNIDVDTDAQMVVSTIVDFAKKMQIKTVAEFVENESILNKVKELGIDYTQGYYFSQPKLTIPT